MNLHTAFIALPTGRPVAAVASVSGVMVNVAMTDGAPPGVPVS